ncbi:hypothetical protein NDU88_012520 [Pleurodeles waltl]|uniref:Uncharacterized protein n=1 Tax=Pleurodeles waltl TaxID=8319 RepID=A0AAV7R6D2_PLEWA|nr:hypothetical protein NDU88_012520 [Pleurodeles waltl]
MTRPAGHCDRELPDEGDGSGRKSPEPPLQCPRGTNEGKISTRIGGRVDAAGRREDVAGERRRHADLKTEREEEVNTEEEEQGGKKQTEEESQGRDGQELKTTLAKENYLETKGRAKKKQADAERSGRCGGVRRVPGGMWLTQVRDHLCGHLGPVLRRMGKKGEMKGQNKLS